MSSEQHYHFFWRTVSPFSQWHKSSYTLGGYSYSTAEQGMMHGKALLFGDNEVATQILQATSPRKIKTLGRKVKGFDNKEWGNRREEIVYRNNMAKFTQNEHLLKALMETEGKLLVEASPSDTIWGIGLNEKDARQVPESQWKGLNLLGKILTQVRDDIMLSSPSSSPSSEEENSNTPLVKNTEEDEGEEGVQRKDNIK